MQRNMSTFGESRIKTLPLLHVSTKKAKEAPEDGGSSLCVFFCSFVTPFFNSFFFPFFCVKRRDASFLFFPPPCVDAALVASKVCLEKRRQIPNFFYSSSFPSPFQNMGFPVLASGAVRSPWQTGKSEIHRKFKKKSIHVF